MQQLRLVVPASLSGPVRQILKSTVGTAHLVVHEGAVRDPEGGPDGDLIEIQIARESVDGLMAELESAGLAGAGSIVLQDIDVQVSETADRVEREDPGSSDDALVWDELIESTGEDSTLSHSFLSFMILATMLAAVGVITDSTVAVVGAMIMGPEFGALAAISVGTVHRKWSIVRSGAIALAAGFTAAILVTAAATWLAMLTGLVHPSAIAAHNRATDFIYHPGVMSFIVALLAGIAGMLSLTSRKSAVLVGVFVSVTTIPAGGYVAVALVLGQADQAAGSAIQLFINLAGIIAAGLLTLLAKQWAEHRRNNRVASSPDSRPADS